jgi:uncharacterized membrane protein YeaQ/YmgE (transglycosylase-associated protein family)
MGRFQIEVQRGPAPVTGRPIVKDVRASPPRESAALLQGRAVCVKGIFVSENSMEHVSHGIIFWLIIGGIAGALAGRIVDGGGFGVIVDIIVGIVGAFIGGWLGGALGLHLGNGIIGSLLTALIGAVILLALVRLFSRGRAGPTV